MTPAILPGVLLRSRWPACRRAGSLAGARPRDRAAEPRSFLGHWRAALRHRLGCFSIGAIGGAGRFARGVCSFPKIARTPLRGVGESESEGVAPGRLSGSRRSRRAPLGAALPGTKLRAVDSIHAALYG